MPTSYIPSKDTDFNSWIINFSTRLSASPGTFGLTAGDAASVAGVTGTWAAAYTAAINPSTRTPVTIAAKDDAKTAALAVVRVLAVQISLNPGVLSDDKIDIGVNPRTSIPTPIPAPNTSPVLSIIAAQTGTAIVRYKDEAAPEKIKAKPYGVTQLMFGYQVSTTPITDPDEIALVTPMTKAPTLFAFDAGDKGKTCYCTARWMTRRGLLGPAAAIVSFVIA